ncbi:LuxR family transcriptional regulator [Rhizobium leguminosarum bv. viciae]|jgi:FixJ family two-component response regulator|uniref:response regulator transcription factor n=1 Tax=Rhizobium leguminosarum TaxID=384 RepID=UPI00103E9E33|nr:LuxR C-terminal-related transcriptional regulator [Rhizobium leguminosarum]MBY5485330.1 LuxR family transcriptional regulator [Rhizobium leguminosarum]TBZ31119.1 LuxR family transcriptional regulator [Rhizobium leguminosarum bv. viciae]TBZ52176.1 LuxR family transcriptional regulator [Rhizobium leguminosarum bv. viciae]TBZ80527.1 LuxR family transcriptional regulator [Rhizobium leguminosarum bv. viciae]TBZ99565.1 LuxR family transcriptional regulator [Rhizobium leguminosarum bv. viciae]
MFPTKKPTDLSTIATTLYSDALVAVLDNGTELDPNLHLHISGMGRQLQRFTSAHDLLSGAQSGCFNCILVDASMADLPVSDLARLICSYAVHCPIIVVTPSGSPATSVATTRFRVTFLPKQDDPAVIAEEVNASIRAFNEANRLEAYFLTLTPRERQVMKFVVEGLLNKQVAFKLNISEITVKAHRGRLMRKMNARTLPDLLYMAARLGPASGAVANELSAF